MKQQSTKVVISDGGFQQNRGLRTTEGVSNKRHCKRGAIERLAEWFAIQWLMKRCNTNTTLVWLMEINGRALRMMSKFVLGYSHFSLSLCVEIFLYLYVNSFQMTYYDNLINVKGKNNIRGTLFFQGLKLLCPGEMRREPLRCAARCDRWRVIAMMMSTFSFTLCKNVEVGAAGGGRNKKRPAS
jgi:hypothetical protein